VRKDSIGERMVIVDRDQVDVAVWRAIQKAHGDNGMSSDTESFGACALWRRRKSIRLAYACLDVMTTAHSEDAASIEQVAPPLRTCAVAAI
jgi:hypothetical protein